MRIGRGDSDGGFGVRGEARLPPGFPPACEGARFGPARPSQLLRHTGAGRFVPSGAEDRQPGVLRQAKLRRLPHRIV